MDGQEAPNPSLMPPSSPSPLVPQPASPCRGKKINPTRVACGMDFQFPVPSFSH